MPIRIKTKWVTLIWGFLVPGILLSGWWFFQIQLKQARQRTIENIASISKLKLAAIADFRSNILAEAKMLSEDSLLIQAVGDWLDNPSLELENEIIGSFKGITDNFKYEDLLLADVSGNIKLSVAKKRQYLSPVVVSAFEPALRQEKPAIVDLHLDPLSGKPHLDIVIPVYQIKEGQKKHLGFFIMEKDPRLSLFPLIQQWPVLNRSAETLLVCRQGDEVVWLNNVRFRPKSALVMKESLTRTDIPAVRAILGQEGVFLGKDYRGVKVISYLSRVPDSNWFMVSKIDTNDAFAGISRNTFNYLLIMILFLALMIMVVKILKQEISYLKLLHEKDKVIGQYVTQLEVANKELEAFSYSISHDLKAPLRAITGYASILFEEYNAKLDKEAQRLINVIHDNVNKMERLIDDLLTLSHAGRQSIQIMDLEMTELARATSDEIKEAMPFARSIEVVIKNLPAARADSRLVRQIFINLISNALKFSSHKDKPAIEIGGYSRHQDNVYYVKDNGVGFDMKYADKLFGVFVRLHAQDQFEGTGIGLAIVKNAILRMGGKVWAEGKIGEGASFYFSLPKGG